LRLKTGFAMNSDELLRQIADYCRRTGVAETTFGRRAVNDGKLVSRLRFGGRITAATLERVRPLSIRIPLPDRQPACCAPTWRA
jgi:hypothetical protein